MDNTTLVTQHVAPHATVADAEAMHGHGYHETAWCLLRNAEGLEPHATMDEVDTGALSDAGNGLFWRLYTVGHETMTTGDPLTAALRFYAQDQTVHAYDRLDACLPALAMVQRWDMTYCEYMEWLDSVCQG